MTSEAHGTQAPSTTARQLGLVLLVAAVVRLLSLAFDSQLPLFRHLPLDGEIYDAAGKQIAGGDWALGTEVLHMSPLYSYFVGLVYTLFGTGPWPLRIVQMLLGLVTVGALFGSARRLWGEPWGFVAGLAAALYGPFVFYDVQVLADGLATCLNAVFVWSVLAARGSPRARGWFGVGLVWGLAIITRPNALLLALPLGVAVVLWRQAAWSLRGRALGLAVAGAVLVVAPVTARNVIVAGERVLVTDSGGLNLYIGNGPGSVGTFHAPPELPEAVNPRAQFPLFKAAAEKAMGRSLSARESDGYWVGKTWRYIQEEPVRWVKLMGEKLWLYWNAREIPNTEDYSFIRELNPILALPLVQFGAIAPLALLGTLLMLWRRRDEELFLGSFNVVLCAANVIVFILAHYRIASVPGLLLAAVGCVQWGVAAWRARATKPLAFAAVALVPVLVLVWTPKLPRPFDSRYFKLGYAYYMQGDLPGAERSYLTALEINPDNISAHKNLAFLYEGANALERARLHWTEVERIAQATGRTDYVRDARSHLDALSQQGF